MIWNKKGFLFFITFTLLIFNQACDGSSDIWRENPPRVYLELESVNYLYTENGELFSNPIELEQVQYGDSISLKLALKVDHMDDLYNMLFTIGFDKDYFKVDSTDFTFTVNNFFAHSEEIFSDTGPDGIYSIYEEGYSGIEPYNLDPAGDNWNDDNNNGVYDEGEGTEANGIWDVGEPFTDTNGNGIWDFFNEPEGVFLPESPDYFLINHYGALEGNIGVGAPEESGTVWGSGVICYIYFSGIMNPSHFSLMVNGVNDLGAGSESVSTVSWDIDPFSLASPVNPSIQIVGSAVEDNEIIVSLYIEDSSPLSYLETSFMYDTNHLDYQQTNFGDFFSDPPYNLSTTSLPSSGEIYFTSKVDGIDESDLFTEIDLDPSNLSEGTGNIINIIFQIVDPQIESTSIQFDLVQALGYNSVLGVPILLNTQFWELQQNVELILTTPSGVDG